MTTSLETRVTRLEDTAGGNGECPRCSGTTVIYLNGKLESVNRDGRLFTPKEAEAFEREEDEEGRCPVCGAARQVITVGGWGEKDTENSSRRRP